MEVLLAIRELRRIAKPCLEKRQDKVQFPVHFTFMLVLERLETSLESLELLVENNPLQHEHAIGLICRNILSDTIITGYIIKSSELVERQPKEADSPASDRGVQSSTDLEGRLHKKLYSLYYDDLQRMVRIAELFQKAGALSDEEAQRYNAQFQKTTSMYKLIHDYAKEFNIEPFPPNTLIFKWLLQSNQQDGWIKELQSSFDVWIYFSKYEHLGLHAYEFTRDLDPKKIESRLKLVLRLAALLLSSCLEMLGKEDRLEESMAIYRQLLSVPTVAPPTHE
ncbi:MAG: hypothetical protein E6Q44_04075 [Flavobacteriales bacterium]|jgi:hypothetical protein|nr:MAG: hypothetical protein E6Q44_04075 [Flavobacteriales bacterium]